MSNKQFFDDMAEHILNNCKTTKDFIDAADKIDGYFKTHAVTDEDTKGYRESGAAEFLVKHTLSYIKEKGLLK